MKNNKNGGGAAVENVARTETISLTQAAELYGVPLHILRRWKADGGLNYLNALVRQRRGGQDVDVVDTGLIERTLGLRRVRLPSGRNGKKRG